MSSRYSPSWGSSLASPLAPDVKRLRPQERLDLLEVLQTPQLFPQTAHEKTFLAMRLQCAVQNCAD